MYRLLHAVNFDILILELEFFFYYCQCPESIPLFEILMNYSDYQIIKYLLYYYLTIETVSRRYFLLLLRTLYIFADVLRPVFTLLINLCTLRNTIK